VAAIAGEHVSGTFRQRLKLSSGRFATIDNGLGYGAKVTILPGPVQELAPLPAC
jgi:hypothetical protein